MSQPETYSPSPPPLATEFSTLPMEIIDTHVLNRLDGPSLASAAACSTTLCRVAAERHLWSNICHSTWPSTTSPCVSQVVSSFPNGGPHAFFSHAFPLPSLRLSSSSSPTPPELISAVDIHYKDEIIFTKVQETETSSGWFRCSPFRIDMLEPKDVVPTSIQYHDGNDNCTNTISHMKLSWILVDPIRRKAMNLSSYKPVSVQRHWLTGEVHVHFTSILAIDHGNVECRIVVTCGGSEGSGDMQVKEVSVVMEDMDGTLLNGKDSLVILHAAMEGEKGNGRNRVEEAQRRYGEYLEMKKERRAKKLRREGTLDMLCVAVGLSIFVAFWCSLLCR